MPTISRFFGITIRMYYEDHAQPHFHAYYGEHASAIAIDSLEIVEGRLPARSFRMVLEWAAVHRQELRANWHRAQAHEPLELIAPLE
jgi:hypothetical protein